MAKYKIINSNNMFSNDVKINCFLSNLFYILLLLVVLYFIFSIYNKFKLNYLTVTTKTNENFESNLNVKSQQESQQESRQESQQKLTKNNELANIKNKLKLVLDEQNKAIFISQNFDKIDESSFANKMNFFLADFTNTNFPTIDINDKKIIKTESELNKVLSETHNMKNFYRPGDLVELDSNFNITRNDICYRDVDNKKTLMQQFPGCMVCSAKSILPENLNNLYNSKSWKNTNTNIDKVCLFNPNAETNSGIANLEQCQKFCNINN